MLEVYKMIAEFLWYQTSILFKSKVNILSRMFEGISIGVYANVIGDYVEDRASINLLYKAGIAIIFTIVSIFLEKDK